MAQAATVLDTEGAGGARPNGTGGARPDAAHADASLDADVRVTGRHMEVGDAMRASVAERLSDMMDRHYGTEAGDGWRADVTLTRADREKDAGRFCADITVHLERGGRLEATGRAHSAGPAFEEAADKVEKRLRRHRRRVKAHRAPRKGFGPEAVEMAYAMLTAAPEEGEGDGEADAPAIVAERVDGAQTHTVASAALALDRADAPVLVFRNAADAHLNIVYRRADGNVGWVDAGSVGAGG